MQTNVHFVCTGQGIYQVASLCKFDPQLYCESPGSGAMSIKPRSDSSPAINIQVWDPCERLQYRVCGNEIGQ
jgi:hypothetical protein